MKTRMEKYYDEANSNVLLREHKNEELYENISNIEVDDYKVDNNETVIGSNKSEIDVEQIKKILDTKYNKTPKRRSIVLEEEETVEPDISLDETREYDINAILERAREEKEVNYTEERVKKLHDTQYDILNNLNLKPKDEEAEPPKENIKKEETDELLDLINTITMHELVNKDKSTKETNTIEKPLDPLDILTDLKGNDDTVVAGVHPTDQESSNETSPIMNLSDATKRKKEMEKSLDLTNTLAFTQSDFDDFNDLKKEVKSNKILIYLIIVIVSIVLVGGILIFLNKFLNIGLF